jgi:phytanoyl-CoA hydroxylase
MPSTFADLRSYTSTLTDRYSCDPSPFTAHDLSTASKQLSVNGFVVLKQAVNKNTVENLNQLFDSFVLSSSRNFRRIDGSISPNYFNEHSLLTNPISNIQLQSSFRHDHGLASYLNSLLNILTNSWHIAALRYHLNCTSLDLLTWNHIHSSPGTMPHQDYLFWGRDILPGQIYGAWFALEDINPFSSPLYLVTNSHMRLTNQLYNHSDISSYEYRRDLVEYMKLNDTDIVAPRLSAGDCLLWDSRLIHGALQLQNPSLSRKSLTAHFKCSKHSYFYDYCFKRLIKSCLTFSSSMKVRVPCHITRILQLDIH